MHGNADASAGVKLDKKTRSLIAVVSYYLRNSSHYTKAGFNNSFIIHSKYF